MKQFISSGVTLGLGLALGAAITVFTLKQHPELLANERAFSNDYHAVLLTNGSAYFGKVIGIDSLFLEMEDVHYISRQQDKDTEESRLVLVKRGKELHGPERMHIKLEQVQFVEPVAEGSKVAKAIEEGK